MLEPNREEVFRKIMDLFEHWNFDMRNARGTRVRHLILASTISKPSYVNVFRKCPENTMRYNAMVKRLSTLGAGVEVVVINASVNLCVV